ncbi:MAG: hypothetical protein PT957_01505 [Firmicutes bacterium]|nr:hypothetical protein [Bacillota bacterium]
MNFSIPEKMPTRNEFLLAFLDAIFPDLEDLQWARTGYGYTSACEMAARETGLLGNDLEDKRLDEDSPLFRLLYEMGRASTSLFHKKPYLLEGGAYEYYGETLFSFCDQTSGSLKGWLRESGSRSRINKSFDAALFFAYLLLSREAASSNRRAFFEQCLKIVGITEIDPIVGRQLFYFDVEELGEEDEINGRPFRRLANRGIRFFGLVTLTIFELMGTYSAEKDGETIRKVHDLFASAFEEEVKASKALEKAQEALFHSIRFFDPRSIQTAKTLYPQDFFVPPIFEQNGEKVDMPLSAIKGASKSQRVKILAKTGMGKTAFLQMASISILADRYGSEKTRASLKAFTNYFDLPRDLYVISIPARMFSFCYRDERYQEWTGDFPSLFFNSMWKLSEGYSFFSSQPSPRLMAGSESHSQEKEQMTKAILEALEDLARAGQLLLVLDSFDEISSGSMRTAYLQALSAFYDRYCSYPEAHEVGAHVIISSREMSPRTMTSLDHALDMVPSISDYRICPLNEDQRRDLVLKWKRFTNIPEEESHALLREIQRNHYYRDYSLNPYMLSVVSFYFGHDLGSITRRFITTLVDRMLKNNRTADPVLYDVLMNILSILQDLALESVTAGKPHFSRSQLDRHLTRWMDKDRLSREEVRLAMDRLHEIFVTEVGLIVPAEGADEDYQFINAQIRFELAAKAIQKILETEEGDFYRHPVLASIVDPKDYVGLMVPLICTINLENVRLAEGLVFDLATRDFSDRTQEEVLVRAMVDLLLNRYGSNITTAAMPGEGDAQYVRRAQRLLLMRLLTSPSFQEMEEDREALAQSPAFRVNAGWFNRDEELH